MEAECSQRFLSQRRNRQRRDSAAADPAWKQSEQPAIPESETEQAATRLSSSGSSVEAEDRTGGDATLQQRIQRGSRESSQRFLSQRQNRRRRDSAAADPAWKQREQPAIPESETEQAATRLCSSGSSVEAERAASDS
ncbi:UNVERIFIED_CONTAM: hypothetical protein FKN15_038157 [Acipenser sinensis]